jgi:hypothetical protein
MKIHVTLILFFSITFSLAQNTVVIQPDGIKGIDANVANFQPVNNFGDHKLMQAFQWTLGPDTMRVRSFFKFDLSDIPEGKEIETAYLSLYGNEDPQGATDAHSTIDGSNESYICRVIEPWEEYTIVWNNQPAWTDDDQVLLPGSLSSSEDYINYNITEIIRYQYKNPAGNFGMVMFNKIKQPHRSMTFLSSDHWISGERPKLTVIYKDAQSVGEESRPQFTLYPNPAKNRISIKLDDNFQGNENINVVISDLIGNNLFSANFKGYDIPDEVDISLLPSGIYFVRIQSGEQIAVKKLIKKD